MWCYLPSNKGTCPQSSKVCLALQDSNVTPEEGERREGTQRRYVHRWIDWRVCRVRGQNRGERAGTLHTHTMLPCLSFLKDRAVRGFEGGRSVFTSSRGTLPKGTLAGWIYPRSSRPTRFSALLNIRSVCMGRRNVVVQESRRAYPTWHVRRYDLLIP